MDRPLAEEKLCVIMSEDQKVWRVSVCRGFGTRQQLGDFPSPPLDLAILASSFPAFAHSSACSLLPTRFFRQAPRP